MVHLKHVVMVWSNCVANELDCDVFEKLTELPNNISFFSFDSCSKRRRPRATVSTTLQPYVVLQTFEFRKANCVFSELLCGPGFCAVLPDQLVIWTTFIFAERERSKLWLIMFNLLLRLLSFGFLVYENLGFCLGRHNETVWEAIYAASIVNCFTSDEVLQWVCFYFYFKFWLWMLRIFGNTDCKTLWICDFYY